MRIWHEKLIPKLCQKHLCAMWREGLGCYKIITENKNGYRNHPATQEFINCPNKLWLNLFKTREEMLSRGYHPKSMPCISPISGTRKPWQTLEEQVAVLKTKNCKCVH